MNRVFPLYALSGFVSLGYQVAWLRIYVDRFGSTDLTFVVVLCNFIGGLGLGALASRRVGEALARRGLGDRLRQYGIVELAVSATALATLAAAWLPADLWGDFPYRLDRGVWEPTLAYRLGVVGVATLCVFVPCFFMGVTFPLLCHAFRGDARFPAALYAWNTLGAGAGVLASEFWLLPWLGHERMFVGLVAANAALGAWFLATGSRPGEVARETRPAEPIEESADGGLSMGVLLTCAVLSGLLSGALEADMLKRVSFLGIRTSTALSFVSFWAVLGIFLGSALVRALPRLSLGHIKVAYLVSLVLYVLVSQGVYAIHAAVFDWLAPPAAQSAPLPLQLFFPPGMLPLLVFLGILVLPAFLPLSLLLPWICNRIQGQRRHLGLAYGTNTVAFCLGTVAFTWIAPRLSVFYSLKLSVVVMAIGVALLLSLSGRGKLAAWKPGVAVAALLAGCVLTPRDFDRSYMIPRTHPTQNEIRAVRSDSSYTTFVVADPAGDMLYFDNVSLSNASLRQQTYMGLMAHFPLLAHPDPREVLLICYGVGNTAAAISTHPTVERVDVVELSRNVIETAPEFARWNLGVHDDPRLRFIHDDGRNFLRTTEERYDLITSEPPPPLHTGVYRLYSREYYRDALAHLNPGGLMTQWLPVEQMPQEAVDLALRSFVDVFPHALVFSGMREELILVGSGAPIDLARLEQRFGVERSVKRHLEHLGMANPEALLARIVQADASLRELYGEGRVIRDAHNDLSRLFLDPGAHGVVPFEPGPVLAELEAQGLRSASGLRAVMTHLGRLQYHAPGFPVSSLTSMRPQAAEGVAGVGVDWTEVARLEQRADRSRAAGRREEARAALRSALNLWPEQPKLLWKLAPLERALGSSEAASQALERFAALEPDDARARLRLGALYEQRGELARAAASYRAALEREPGSPAGPRLAQILASAADPALRDGAEALRLAESARDAAGAERPDVLAALAAAHAELGDFEAAVRWQQQALARAPEPARAAHAADLDRYRRGEPRRRPPR